MAKAYWINTFRSISDPARLDAYIKPVSYTHLTLPTICSV